MLNAEERRSAIQKKLSRIKETLAEHARALGIAESAFREAVAECLVALAENSARARARTTKVGLAAARRAGKRLGRPQIEIEADKLLAVSTRDMTVREMAKRLKVSISTAHRLRKEAGLVKERGDRQ